MHEFDSMHSTMTRRNSCPWWPETCRFRE